MVIRKVKCLTQEHGKMAKWDQNSLFQHSFSTSPLAFLPIALAQHTSNIQRRANFTRSLLKCWSLKLWWSSWLSQIFLRYQNSLSKLCPSRTISNYKVYHVIILLKQFSVTLFFFIYFAFLSPLPISTPLVSVYLRDSISVFSCLSLYYITFLSKYASSP